MKRYAIVCGLLVGGLPAYVFAQQETAKAKNDTIVITGCVATAPEPGHFTLTDAVAAGTATSSPSMMPTSPAADTKKDSKASTTYKLMGGELKPHIGHKVEVTGTMEDMKAMGGGKPATVSPASEMVNVKSVKMIAPTCP